MIPAGFMDPERSDKAATKLLGQLACWARAMRSARATAPYYA